MLKQGSFYSPDINFNMALTAVLSRLWCELSRICGRCFTERVTKSGHTPLFGLTGLRASLLSCQKGTSVFWRMRDVCSAVEAIDSLQPSEVTVSVTVHGQSGIEMEWRKGGGVRGCNPCIESSCRNGEGKPCFLWFCIHSLCLSCNLSDSVDYTFGSWVLRKQKLNPTLEILPLKLLTVKIFVQKYTRVSEPVFERGKNFPLNGCLTFAGGKRLREHPKTEFKTCMYHGWVYRGAQTLVSPAAGIFSSLFFKHNEVTMFMHPLINQTASGAVCDLQSCLNEEEKGRESGYIHPGTPFILQTHLQWYFISWCEIKVLPCLSLSYKPSAEEKKWKTDHKVGVKCK